MISKTWKIVMLSAASLLFLLLSTSLTDTVLFIMLVLLFYKLK